MSAAGVQAAGGRLRIALWVASVIVAALLLPFPATIVACQLAGQLWQKAQLTLPLLSQAADLISGALLGALFGLLAKAVLRLKVAPFAAAGVAAGLAHAIYPPLILLALPAAAASAALAQNRSARFVRGQGIAAALIGLALFLPFPAAARLGLVLAASLLSAWSIRSAGLLP